MYVYVCMYVHTHTRVYIWKETYYKEAARVILEAYKSHSLQSAGWGPRRAGGVVSFIRWTGSASRKSGTVSVPPAPCVRKWVLRGFVLFRAAAPVLGAVPGAQQVFCTCRVDE